MEEMISVNNLRKEFSYYKKGVGLQGSLNNLFHRQMLTKEAVKDVSFSVEKGESGGRTFTRVIQLDREARKAELARITGGSQVTPALLESAGELLDQADAYRKQHFV